MDRIQLACTGLIASAFILAGLLVVNLGNTPAQASEVIDKGDFTLMTAQTAANEEALFVLNNSTGDLVVYSQSLRGNSGTLELIGQTNLSDVFANLR